MPTKETASKVQDYLLRARGVDAFLKGIPEAPKGFECNWLQTIPGKSWFVILRMYGPLKPFIEKIWRTGEIELVK